MTEVRGASPEQREILREILAGLPDTTISVLRVEPEYDLEPERDENDNPPPDWDPTRSLGDALRLLEPEWPDFRTQWELELVGAAFHRLSRERGLPAVVAVHSAQSGHYHWDGEDDAPKKLDRKEVDWQIRSAASTTGALLDRVELLEPGGLAVAVSLAVPEAHGFLRHGLDAFVALSGLTDGALAGSFVRLEDGEPEPVVELYGRRGMGAQRSRRDVQCCVSHGFGGLTDPGPPPCPFPSRTWDDMFDAFRSNLPTTTGRDLREWRAMVASEGRENSWDQLTWLEREHGLGHAEAYAIATAEA
jgi:hypothetical protein